MSGKHYNAVVASALEASACGLSFIDESDHDTDNSGYDGQLQECGNPSHALAARAHSHSLAHPECPPHTEPPTLLRAPVPIPTPNTTIAPTQTPTPGWRALHLERRARPPGARAGGGGSGRVASGCKRQSALAFRPSGLERRSRAFPPNRSSQPVVFVQCSEKH